MEGKPKSEFPGLFKDTSSQASYYIDGPWNHTVNTQGGGISRVRADKETRERQLREFKEKRIAELQAEIRRVEMLF